MPSLYENFVGNDWARYSALASKVSCVGSVVIGVISILLGFSFLIGFWTLFCGLLLAIWEFPSVFRCIPRFDEVENFLMEKCRLKFEETKAGLYVALSIICYWWMTPCMAAGMLLDLTGLLFAFAAINRRVDEADGSSRPPQQSSSSSANKYVPPGTSGSTLLNASNFGTF